jgi:hypothetical protein
VNVKKGDMAILMKSQSDENVGKICEVLEYVGRQAWRETNDINDTWLVRFPEPIMVYLNTPTGVTVSSQTEACVADAWLMPIRPAPEEDIIDTEIIDEATV